MKNILRNFKLIFQVGILILYSSVVYDIFKIEGASDFRFFGIIILYFIITYILKIRSTITFLFLLLLLFIMSFRYFTKGPDVITEEAAVWFVLFFTVGIFQKWIES